MGQRRAARFGEIRGGRFGTRTRAERAAAGAVVLVIDGFDGVARPDASGGRLLFVGDRVGLELPSGPRDRPST